MKELIHRWLTWIAGNPKEFFEGRVIGLAAEVGAHQLQHHEVSEPLAGTTILSPAKDSFRQAFKQLDIRPRENWPFHVSEKIPP